MQIVMNDLCPPPEVVVFSADCVSPGLGNVGFGSGFFVVFFCVPYRDISLGELLMV